MPGNAHCLQPMSVCRADLITQKAEDQKHNNVKEFREKNRQVARGTRNKVREATRTRNT